MQGKVTTAPRDVAGTASQGAEGGAVRGRLVRMGLLQVGLGVAAVLGLVWLVGGFDAAEQWVAGQQREAQQAIAGAVRALRSGQAGAVWGLLALAFGYGVLHAAGPGHGKVLIGGYGVARRVALLPLAAIALAASLAQAAVAVALVYATVALLGWTRDRVLGAAEDVMAPVGHLLIMGLGFWLVWRGIKGVRALARDAAGAEAAAFDQPQAIPVPAFFLQGPRNPDTAPLGLAPFPATQTATAAFYAVETPAAVRQALLPVTDSLNTPQKLRIRLWQGLFGPRPKHVSGYNHDDACGCGHAHGPTPDQINALTNGRDVVALIAGIAVRPCSGALFVLILTWQLGIGGAGVAAAFAMGLGTALVTIAVAGLAVWAREGALSSLATSRVARALPVLELLAGAAIIMVAVGLLRTSG